MNQKKTKKLKNMKLIIAIMLVIVIILMSGYYSTDLKNDQQVTEYLTNYINQKYNIDCNLILKEKELVSFCTASVDGCIHYANNNNIYRYEYTGIDKNNNEFLVNYTNSYIGKGVIHKSEIDENYYIYKHIKDIKKIVGEYYSTFDVYYELTHDNNKLNEFNNEIVIMIYSNEKNIIDLSIINDKILDFNKYFKIIITTDYKTYEKILNKNSDLFKRSYLWQEPNILTESLGYINLKYNFNNNSEYKQALSSIKFKENKDEYTIVLMNRRNDTKFYIYQQLNNE